MTTATAFVYHAVTLRLLDGQPTPSARAVARIERWEQKCGRQLPASVREWYSLQDADQWLADDDFGCRASSLERLLKNFRRRCLSSRQLLPLWEYSCDSTCYEAALIPNESDDPAVEVNSATKTSPVPFSQFIREVVWDTLTSYLRPHAATPGFVGRLGPLQLGFLAEGYEELSREAWTGCRDPFRGGPVTELQEFRYFDGRARIRIVSDGNPATGEREASWAVHARGPDELLGALMRLWPCHGYPLEFFAGGHADDQTARRFAAMRVSL